MTEPEDLRHSATTQGDGKTAAAMCSGPGLFVQKERRHNQHAHLKQRGAGRKVAPNQGDGGHRGLGQSAASLGSASQGAGGKEVEGPATEGSSAAPGLTRQELRRRGVNARGGRGPSCGPGEAADTGRANDGLAY